METCQVCGNPIFGFQDMGINADGSLNGDYCSNCYKSGQFISGDYNQTDENGLSISVPIIPLALIGAGNQQPSGVGFINPMM